MKDASATPATPARATDVGTIRLVIKGAILVALFCLAAGVLLAETGYREGAIVLLAAPNAAITGLFGLLAKTSTDSRAADGTTPAPVQIDQPPDKPVPVVQEQEAETDTAPTAPVQAPETDR